MLVLTGQTLHHHCTSPPGEDRQTDLTPCLPFPEYLDIVGIDVVRPRHALIRVSEGHARGVNCRRVRNEDGSE